MSVTDASRRLHSVPARGLVHDREEGGEAALRTLEADERAEDGTGV